MSGRCITPLCGLFLLLLLGVAQAMEKGNQHRGKAMFQANCKPCHMEGEGRRTLEEPLHPDRKTQAQWTRYFERKAHPRYEEIWGAVPDRDLADIHAYLRGHAYDSPSPAKCK